MQRRALSAVIFARLARIPSFPQLTARNFTDVQKAFIIEQGEV